MHSQIYSELSLISAILWNFRVTDENEFIRARLVRPAGANGFILALWENIIFFYPIGKKKVTLEPLLGRKTTKIVHVLQKFILRKLYVPRNW